MLTPFTYAGSKRKELKTLSRFFPRQAEIVVEPFAGTAIVSGVYANRSLINDNNEDISYFWKLAKSFRKELFGILDEMMKEEYRDETLYYIRRREFNEEYYHKDVWNTRRAALFYYLIMSCHASMVRYGKMGFNVGYKHQLGFKKYDFDRRKKSIETISDKMELITNLDALEFLKSVIDGATEELVIYCDPPYVKSGIDYKGSWNFDNLMELDNILHYAKTKGHRSILQNYANGEFAELSKSDTIISKKTARRISNWQSIKEDVIVLYGETPNFINDGKI